MNRISYAIELRIAGFEGQDTLKQWLYYQEGAIQRIRNNRKVFWPRFYIRICGVSFGIALYIDYQK